MREAGLDDNPGFYTSPAGNPYTEAFHKGGFLGFTALTVLEQIKEDNKLPIRTLGFKGEILEFNHNQKARCDVFARYRRTVNEAWTSIPSIEELGGALGSTNYVKVDNITEDKVYIEFFALGGGVELEFDILLIDFKI